ncbi:unnamed protein product [Paramecium pentaurelia]|uniref:Uncharacterized protein n=1 Tax=Paramecium pentaurelia TaxID=43138 RepID=A0A8S1S9Z3_9CILI|nr:unnamed protein product [Paramecium pentaurelia]
MLSETVIQQSPAKKIIKRIQGYQKKGILTSQQDELNNFQDEHKQTLEDRLKMQNYLKEAKEEIMKIANQNNNYMIFSSYEEMSKHRETRRNEEQQMIFKPLQFPTRSGSVIRCKKIQQNTTPEEMNANYGILTLEQKLRANKAYSDRQETNSPNKFDFTEKFHHIEGKIAKQNRIEIIKEYSKIYKRVQIKAFPKQLDESQYTSKYRQAVQKVQVINHRKSGKNILPVLSIEKKESVESVLSDLNYSRWSLEQDVSYQHIPDQKIRLQQRLGGGFTKINREKYLEYYSS